MSYLFYKDILRELGYKVKYEAISNFYGDSYATEREEIIEKYNPFLINIEEGQKQNKRVTIGMLRSMGIQEKNKIRM
jgi:hypothetical protein